MPNGKICYLEIPSTDPESSARFYNRVFGWSVRARGDGTRAFDDTTGAVSGAFVTGRDPHRTVDVVTYIMVDDIDATLLLVAANGGSVHAQRTELSPAGDAYALFVDIAGNVFGVYQEPRKC
jgi:predicted enzyme related to lactoylglutathione lyase